MPDKGGHRIRQPFAKVPTMSRNTILLSGLLVTALAASGAFPVPECEPGKLTPLPAL